MSDKGWAEVLKVSEIEVAYHAVHALEAAGIQAEVWGSGSSMPAWQVAIIGGPAALFGDHSMHGVERRYLGWRMWWSGPWLATRLVTATRP